jgi:hypothetical protein
MMTSAADFSRDDRLREMAELRDERNAAWLLAAAAWAAVATISASMLLARAREDRRRHTESSECLCMPELHLR